MIEGAPCSVCHWVEKGWKTLLYTLMTPWSWVLPENPPLFSYSRISQHFMAPKASSPCSQQPSTGPYPEPDEYNPYHPIRTITPSPRSYVTFRNTFISTVSCYAHAQPPSLKTTPCRLSLTRALLATCFHAGFLLSLFFDLEDEGDMFLRNVGWISMDLTALYPRRQKSSRLPLWEFHILQNWNVLTILCKILTYQISWKFIHRLTHWSTVTDGPRRSGVLRSP
jgi:hypothetical protein